MKWSHSVLHRVMLQSQVWKQEVLYLFDTPTKWSLLKTPLPAHLPIFCCPPVNSLAFFLSLGCMCFLSWVYVFVCMYVCAHVRVCTCTCVSTRLCKALIPLAAGPSLVTIMSHHVCKDQTTKTLCQPCGQYLCHPCTICKWETFWEYFGGERHSYNLIIYFPGVCWKRWLKDLLQV